MQHRGTETNQNKCLNTLHTYGHMKGLTAHIQACTWSRAVPHDAFSHTQHRLVVINSLVKQYCQVQGHHRERILLLCCLFCHHKSCTGASLAWCGSPLEHKLHLSYLDRIHTYERTHSRRTMEDTAVVDQ